MLTKDQIIVGGFVIGLGFFGMGLWRTAETAWNDHGQIGENIAQIEVNRTNVQAVINYLNQQGAGFQQVPAEEPDEPPTP